MLQPQQQQRWRFHGLRLYDLEAMTRSDQLLPGCHLGAVHAQAATFIDHCCLMRKIILHGSSVFSFSRTDELFYTASLPVVL